MQVLFLDRFIRVVPSILPIGSRVLLDRLSLGSCQDRRLCQAFSDHRV